MLNLVRLYYFANNVTLFPLDVSRIWYFLWNIIRRKNQSYQVHKTYACKKNKFPDFGFEKILISELFNNINAHKSK